MALCSSERGNEYAFKRCVNIMRNRKRTHPYLAYSLLIHCLLLLGIWWLSPKQPPLTPFQDWIEISIAYIKRPVLEPPRVELPLPIEPAAPVVVQPEKPPAPAKPKPKPGLNAAWLTTRSDEAVAIRRQENVTTGRSMKTRTKTSVADGMSPVPNPKTSQHVKVRATTNSLNRAMVAVPPASKTANMAPQAETCPIALGTDDALKGASPTVGAPKIYYGSQRGEALRATGTGNSWGGGSTSGSANVGGTYVQMMKDVARELAAAATVKKVDIVFILDETESMKDNIRGLRAYVDFLFEALERDGHDATFGLVTFTDKVKIHGRTDDLGTFKNWLFQIGVEGGGDIVEAGLDALMTAVTKSKFRRGAQRLFILASDAAFHDADYDGRSAYSLDAVIETLQNEQIRVDVIGIDYLPIQQIAMATGGTWRAIPGRGYLEYVPPLTLTVKMFSKLGTLHINSKQLDDKITVYINNPPRPKTLTLTWKVLNPLGERCYGPFTEQKNIPDDGSTQVELTPGLNSTAFQTIPGTYTVIYRLENEQGHQSILRRTLTY